MHRRTNRPGMGWVRDLPDFRDYTVEHDQVSDKLKAQGQDKSVHDMLVQANAARERKRLPKAVDLREWCSPIEDQQSIGSCTAHAGIGLIEYFEMRAFGKHIDASRLFLYKVTRNLLLWEGDTGAYLRTTMAAMRLFGAPPEEYYPYDIELYDEEPPAFCYAFADSYKAAAFYRLDPPGTSNDELLARIKTQTAAGLPSMFGFTVFSSIAQANETGRIPYPTKGDKDDGGHAVAVVGYDDGLKIKNTNPQGQETTGAFRIRNSWGTGWGEAGYGWLPYDYVRKGLAVDWWSLLRNEWIDTGHFGL